MTSIFTSLHLLNLKHLELRHTFEVDCIKLSEKYNCSHGEYSSAKSEYLQSRCTKCQHQWKIKKNIKYVNELLRKHKYISLTWDSDQPLILFFSNGSIVSMEFNDKNNTLLKVDIDNNLCGKFLSSRVVDIIMCKNCIYITYLDPKLTLVYINQDSSSILGKIFRWKKGKLVGFEPKIVNIDLHVPHNTKSLERKLALNIQKDLLLIWWVNSSDDVWPWTPIAYLTDSTVNMILYSVNGNSIELLCSIKVQDELLHANFSKEHFNKFFTLEEVKKDKEIIVNVCIHELIHGNCQLAYTEKLPVRGSLIVFHWSSTEDKLLAADTDGLLLIYDVKKKSTIVTNLEFLPKHLSWHPQNCIALVVSKNNRILCFDAALSIINMKLCYRTSLELEYLELSSYFHDKFSIQNVLWQKSVFNDTCLFLLNSELSSFILMTFSFGCITRHNITALEIVSQYLKSDSFNKANLLLRSLNWCYKSDVKFQSLSKIVNCLLRKPLSFDTQSALEFCLATFYDIVEVLPKRIVKMYEHRMHHLARRYFHHLLRYCQFRKAFLLAVDLESQDLFLDLYHVAKQKDQDILASVALHKAEEFDDLSGSSVSYSSDSHSESSYSNDADIGSQESNPGDDVVWSESSCNDELGSSFLSLKRLPNKEENEQYNSNPAEHMFCNSRRNFAVIDSEYSNYPTVCPDIESRPNSSYSSGLIESSCQKNSYASDHSCDSFKNMFNNILENYNYPRSRNIRDDSVFKKESEKFEGTFEVRGMEECSVIEEESEEMEGTEIKLAHLGVI